MVEKFQTHSGNFSFFDFEKTAHLDYLYITVNFDDVHSI